MFPRFRRAHQLFLPIPPILVALFGWLMSRNEEELEGLGMVETATHGLVTAGFLLSLAATGVVLAAVFLAGRIKLDDVGLHRDYLGRGVGVVTMIWGASQVIGVIPRVVANRPVLLDHAFEYGSRWEIGGEFLSSLGSATLEEIAFRGFLLVQLYLLLNQGNREARAGTAWASAITVLVATLATLPRTLPYPSVELAAIDLAVLLLGNLYLCLLYLRTKNLFFVIGVHALLLAPSPVVAGPRGGGLWYQPLVIAILATFWALLWPRRD